MHSPKTAPTLLQILG